MMGGEHSTCGVFLPKVRHNLHCIMRTQQTDLSHRPFDITKSSTTCGLRKTPPETPSRLQPRELSSWTSTFRLAVSGSNEDSWKDPNVVCQLDESAESRLICPLATALRSQEKVLAHRRHRDREERGCLHWPSPRQERRPVCTGRR